MSNIRVILRPYAHPDNRVEWATDYTLYHPTKLSEMDDHRVTITVINLNSRGLQVDNYPGIIVTQSGYPLRVKFTEYLNAPANTYSYQDMIDRDLARRIHGNMVRKGVDYQLLSYDTLTTYPNLYLTQCDAVRELTLSLYNRQFSSTYDALEFLMSKLYFNLRPGTNYVDSVSTDSNHKWKISTAVSNRQVLTKAELVVCTPLPEEKITLDKWVLIDDKLHYTGPDKDKYSIGIVSAAPTEKLIVFLHLDHPSTHPAIIPLIFHQHK